MPLFEYTCHACEHAFELLVRSQDTPRCPQCESENLEKHFSLPKVQGEGSRDRALRAARKRDARQGRERMHEQLRYEQSHDRHG